MGCVVALLPVLAVAAFLGYVIWLGSASGGPPPESHARHLPLGAQRDLPLDEYGLAQLCPDRPLYSSVSLRRIRSRRAVELDALVRQLESDRDVAVLATFLLADVPAEKAEVRQWTSLEDLTQSHIDALRDQHCAPAAAKRLRQLIDSP